jgi:hypothetical protein
MCVEMIRVKQLPTRKGQIDAIRQLDMSKFSLYILLLDGKDRTAFACLLFNCTPTQLTAFGG